jgi:membrane protein implicated in regulation of membrane protease activity
MDAAAPSSGPPVLGWIAIGGVFLIGELMTGSGWLLWPAGSAGAVGVATLIFR